MPVSWGSLSDIEANTMSPNPIRVVMMAKEAYALRLAAAIRSITDHLACDRSLEILLLDDATSEATRRRLEGSWNLERTDLEWVDIRRAGVPLIDDVGGLEPIYLARTAAQDYAPGWNRAILLDPDVLVLTDLGRLWDLPLGDHSLLATRDPWITSLSHPDGVADWRAAGLDPDAAYFSAAVMSVDLERYRRDDLSNRVREFTRAFGGGIRYGEQDLLNALLSDRWGELDPRWQVHPRIADRPRLVPDYLAGRALETIRTDPWIYHFGGRLKPWDYRSPSAADRLFYEVLDRTAWKGWRPPVSLRGLVYRAYDSPLRNILHPIEMWARRAG